MRYLMSLLTLLLCITTARAADIEIINPLQETFRGLSEDMGAAYSYKGLNPAEPLGILGFNLGVVGSYTSVENEQLITDLTGQDIGELGAVGISATKGLPLNIDVGAYYTEDPNTNVSLIGIELRYAILEGSAATPAVGLRAAATQIDGIDSFDFNTYSIDVSISKGLTLFTPYGGIGQVFVKSDPNAFLGLEDESFELTRIFLGTRVTLLPFAFTGEVDRTGDNTSFNLRAAIAF